MKIYFSPAYKGHLYIDFTKLQNDVAFDTCYRNTEGLYELLATHLGVHVPHFSEGLRLAAYFQAMAKYISDNPNCILAASFKNSPLATTSECLRWRDELALYGWSEKITVSSKRLIALQGIEKLFDSSLGREALEREVMKALEVNPSVLKGSEIVVPLRKEVLPLKVQKLLDILKEGGCQVNYDQQDYDYERLLHKANGFEIWDFESTQDAMRYLATLKSDSKTCYISTENTSLDSWMYLFDGVTSGSKITNSHTGSCALLLLGIKTLFKPLDIISMLEWLNLPIHPLPYHYQLANKINSRGGYHNQECQELIQSTESKEGKKLAKWLPKICMDDNNSKTEDITVEQLKTFTENLLKWAKSKWKQWSKNSDASVQDALDGNTLGAHALEMPQDWSDLIELCYNFIKILDKYPAKTISRESAEELAFSLVPAKESTLHSACLGCKDVISSPGCMVDKPDVTIICEAYGEHPTLLSCSFLSKAEREELSKHLDLWNPEAERGYNFSLMMFPLTHTKNKLILVVCHKDGSTPLNKHPLVIWAQGRLGQEYECYVKHPVIGTDFLEDREVVNNDISANEIKLTQHDKMHWSTQESPTSLEKLLDSPLDYAMDKLIRIKSATQNSISNISIVKGNVAHATIEMLFNPRQEECTTVDAKTLRSRFKNEFTDTVTRATNDRGAILLLREYSLELQQFTKSLKECILRLINIIDANALEVLCCEYTLNNIDLGLKKVGVVGVNPEQVQDTNLVQDNNNLLQDNEQDSDNNLDPDNDQVRDNNPLQDNNDKADDNGIQEVQEEYLPVAGRIDMLLKNSEGEKVIIDLKWTNNNDQYHDKLSSGTAYQLDMYNHMLHLEDGSTVRKSGYFVMPQGVLYSRESFAGSNTKQVKEEDEAKGKDPIKAIRDNYNRQIDAFSQGSIVIKDNEGNPIMSKYSDYDLFYGKEQTKK